MPENETETQGPLTASVERLRKELDHWLEAALTQGEKTLDKLGLRGTGRDWRPPIDIIETSETIEILVDVPGVEPGSVDLTLVGNMLTIEAEKPAFAAGDGDTMHTRERLGGRISRSIPMPVAVDPENVVAEAVNGVLHVRLSKAHIEVPQQIQVNAPPPKTSAVS